MEKNTLNCVGMLCPQPVLKCKECLDNSRPPCLAVEVDNAAAAENVSRYLESQGYKTETVTIDDGFQIIGTDTREECSECEVMTDQAISQATSQQPVSDKQTKGTVAFITSDCIGRGDDGLGGKLMQNFLLTLPEMGSSLWRIMLVNSAVKLVTKGNPGLEPLQKLSNNGISILVCGTCLEHYGLLDAKEVGDTTNMLDIVTSMDLADKIIKV